MSKLCKSIQGKLSRLIAGELRGVEQDSVKAHLADCAQCRSLYETRCRIVRSESRRNAADALAATMAAMETRFDMSEARRLRERDTVAGRDTPLSADEVASTPLEDSLIRDSRTSDAATGFLRRLFAPHPAWRWATLVGGTLAVCLMVILILDRDPQLPQTAMFPGLDPEAGDQGYRASVSVQPAAPPARKSMTLNAAGSDEPIETVIATDAVDMEIRITGDADRPAPDATAGVSESGAAKAGASASGAATAGVPASSAAKGHILLENVKKKEHQEAVIDAIESSELAVPSPRQAQELAEVSAVRDTDQMQATIDKLNLITGDDRDGSVEDISTSLIAALESAELKLMEDGAATEDAVENDSVIEAESKRGPPPRDSGGASWGQIKTLTDHSSRGDTDRTAPQPMAASWLAIADGWFLLSEAESETGIQTRYLEKALSAYRRVTGLTSLEMSHVERRIAYLELLKP